MMTKEIIITAIVENNCLKHGLMAQHGQSLLINYYNNFYLFDTAEIFIGLENNLKKLKVNINKLKAVIISHNHDDHCGALPTLTKLLTDQPVYLPEKLNSIKKAIILKKEYQLEKDLYITGPLGDQIKEQSIVIDLKDKGIVIITGCSHPTLPIIIEKAQQITNNQKIYGIIGGFHYKNASALEIEEFINYLKNLNLEFIVPSHCTGYQTIIELKKQLKDKVYLSPTGSLGVGTVFQITPKLKLIFSHH